MSLPGLTSQRSVTLTNVESLGLSGWSANCSVCLWCLVPRMKRSLVYWKALHSRVHWKGILLRTSSDPYDRWVGSNYSVVFSPDHVNLFSTQHSPCEKRIILWSSVLIPSERRYHGVRGQRSLDTWDKSACKWTCLSKLGRRIYVLLNLVILPSVSMKANWIAVGPQPNI